MTESSDALRSRRDGAEGARTAGEAAICGTGKPGAGEDSLGGRRRPHEPLSALGAVLARSHVLTESIKPRTAQVGGDYS